MDGVFYFFNYIEPGRPVEENSVVEIEGVLNNRKSFLREDDALIYLFDSGAKTYKYLTKEIGKYKNTKNLFTYEFWHINNRVGYVKHDYEHYVDENGTVQKKRAFVFRFVGFGRRCFAETKEELKDKVLAVITEYNTDRKQRGYNTYPYYTRYYREEK